MKVSLTDYCTVLLTLVKRTLPTLDFENSDHYREGHELLGRLGHVGARLIYDSLHTEGKEQDNDND